MCKDSDWNSEGNVTQESSTHPYVHFGWERMLSWYNSFSLEEYILRSANREDVANAEIEPAPKPLLPNYGVGKIRPYNLDLDMMILFNSQERHLEHFIKLGQEAGLKFVKVWDLKEMGVIEFILV